MAASVQIIKVNWWHERLADYMIAYPDHTLTEIAAQFKKSPAWISIVKNSDAFVDYWQKRSSDHSEAVTSDIKTKAYAAAELALDNILDKVSGGPTALTIDQNLDVYDTTLKRLGYGVAAPKAAPGPELHLHAHVTPDMLAEARAKMRALTSAPKELDRASVVEPLVLATGGAAGDPEVVG